MRQFSRLSNALHRCCIIRASAMNVSADFVASTSGRPAMASADTRPITLALHPQRDALANEVHARPTMPLEAPQSVSHLAVLTGEHAAAEDHAHLVLLCTRHGVAPPAEGVNHFSADLGLLR